LGEKIKPSGAVTADEDTGKTSVRSQAPAVNVERRIKFLLFNFLNLRAYSTFVDPFVKGTYKFTV